MKSAHLFFMLFILLVACRDSQKSNSETKMENKPLVTSQFVFSTEKLKRYQFPTHINDLVIDRANSSFSEVFMVIIEPNKAPVYHKHDDTEQIFYIIEGTGVLTIGDDKKQIPVKVGDVVRIPVSTFHSIRADDKQTMKYLCVDCFGEKPKLEPTWDDHVKVVCKNNGWKFEDVVKQ